MSCPAERFGGMANLKPKLQRICQKREFKVQNFCQRPDATSDDIHPARRLRHPECV